MAELVRTGPGQGLGARNIFWVSQVNDRHRIRGHLPVPLPGHDQGAEVKVEQPGIDSASIWDIGATGSGFTSYAKTLTRRFFDEASSVCKKGERCSPNSLPSCRV